MLYVLHGEDDLTRTESLADLKRKLGDPAMVDLNTTVLDGTRLDITALRHACDAVAFLCDSRLVIVQGLWSRFEPSEEQKSRGKVKITPRDQEFLQALATYLPQVPDSTRLAFIDARSLSEGNPVFQVLPHDDKRVYVRNFAPPEGASLNRWIQDRAKAKGGAIAAHAAEELAHLVGSNLRQLDQELDKLVAHANYERPVNVSDVHHLVRTLQTPNIFALVDALGMRRGEQAVQHLHELLDDGAAPLYLLHMIERQFRILLQISELQSQKATPAQMQKATGVRQSFVLQKTTRQARNFSLARLQAIYTQLADIEQQIKTGRIESLLALDLLVVELCA